MKCLVTGATGFIGRVLLEQLHQAGHEVLAFSRCGTSGPAVHALDLTVDSIDPAQLRNVDVVFHLAGIAHQRAEPEAYERLNVQATLQLARQAAAAAVPLFVFLSSVKAQQCSADASPVQDPYAGSKSRAEQALLEAFGDGPMRLVIVRPALVYGAGVKGNLAALARAVARGMPRPPALGSRSMVSVSDLVRALCLVADRGPRGPGGAIWTITDGQGYSTRRLYDALSRACGREPGRVWLPLWCWRLMAGLQDLLARAEPGSHYARLFGSEIYDGSAFGEAFGWTAMETFEDEAPRLVAAQGSVSR